MQNSQENQLQVYQLAASDIDEAASLLANAFIDYPLHQYLFQSDWHRIDEFFTWYFKCILKTFLKKAAIICLGKPIKGICIYSLPESPDITLWQFFKAGFYQVPFKVSIKSIKRLICVNNAFKQYKTISQERIVHVDILAIDPQYQGQGVGKQLFHHITKQPDYKYLIVTHKIANVQFYEKMGCKLMKVEQLQKSTVESFFMSYDS